MIVAIVEDEIMIAFMIQDVLNSFGLEDTRLYHSYEEAEQAFADHEFDAVLLDLNLHGVMTIPLALRLRQHGVPTLIVSSYAGSTSAYDDLKDFPALSKPFSDRQMKTALTNLGVL